MKKQKVDGVGGELRQAWGHLAAGLSTIRRRPALLVWPVAAWLIATVSRTIDFISMQSIAPPARSIPLPPLAWPDVARLGITATGRAVSPFPTFDGPATLIEEIASRLPLPAVLGVVYFALFRLAAVALFVLFLTRAALSVKPRRVRAQGGDFRPLFAFGALAALWLNLYTLTGGIVFAISGSLALVRFLSVWQGTAYLLFVPVMLTASVLALSRDPLGAAVRRSLSLVNQGLFELLVLLVSSVLIFMAATLWRKLVPVAPFSLAQLLLSSIVLALIALIGAWFVVVWLHFTADRLRQAAKV